MATRMVSFGWVALVLVSAGCGDDVEGPPIPYGGAASAVRIPSRDGSVQTRVEAYFLDAQVPDLVAPELPLGECGQVESGLQMDRRYIDVGDDVTFHLGDTDVVAPRSVHGADWDGNTHDVLYSNHTFDPMPFDGLMTVTAPESRWSAGRLEVPLPPMLAVDHPSLDAITHYLALPPSSDLEITWHHDGEVDGLFVEIVFFDSTARARTRCRVADTGAFTIPAAVLDGLGFDDGLVSIRTVSHSSVVSEEGRGIDVTAAYVGFSELFTRAVSP